MVRRASAQDVLVVERVDRAIDALHGTINEIRNFIFGLRPVLLFVGIWMHGKSQADEWRRYIREKMQHALSKGSASDVEKMISALENWSFTGPKGQQQIRAALRPRRRLPPRR